MFTLIIPSYNEENYIGPCLEAVRQQRALSPNHEIQVIIAANACKDRTVAVAKEAADGLHKAGFSTIILSIKQPSKINAINTAERHATFENRVYLDADVIISPGLLAEMATAFDRPEPVYVGGTVQIPRSESWITRAYGKVWMRLPFVRDGVPGIGLYAFNAAGRARWNEFPAIIADDRFARLQFAPSERVKLAATYDWPLPVGFSNMVNARRRWCEGNDELHDEFPQLMVNDSQRNNSPSNFLSLFKTPFSSAIFVSIYLISWGLTKTRSRNAAFHWRRGRV